MFLDYDLSKQGSALLIPKKEKEKKILPFFLCFGFKVLLSKQGSALLIPKKRENKKILPFFLLRSLKVLLSKQSSALLILKLFEKNEKVREKVDIIDKFGSFFSFFRILKSL